MLNPITPGLRALHYDSNQVAKVQIQVQPGDVLHVSDDVADQLQRADTHFKPVVDQVTDKRSAKPGRKADPKGGE